MEHCSCDAEVAAVCWIREQLAIMRVTQDMPTSIEVSHEDVCQRKDESLGLVLLAVEHEPSPSQAIFGMSSIISSAIPCGSTWVAKLFPDCDGRQPWRAPTAVSWRIVSPRLPAPGCHLLSAVIRRYLDTACLIRATSVEAAIRPTYVRESRY